MTLLEQLRDYKAPSKKSLSNSEKEIIIKFYEKRGKLKTMSEHSLTESELKSILKEAGKA